MDIVYDKTTITFTTHSSAEAVSINYLGPYRYGATGHVFKVPVTLTTLEEIANKFGVVRDDKFYDLYWHLETSLMLTQNQFNDSLDPDLRPYQYQGVSWLNYTLQNYGAAGLFWDPRVGKTRTTVKATNHFNKVLVLALAGQEDNWISNYKDFSDHTKIITLHKKSKEKRKAIYQEFYEDASVVLVGSINTLTQDALDPIMGYHLRGTRVDCLVVDEVHKIKNRNTRLFKGAKVLRENSLNVIGLTGTPVSRNAADIIGIITFLFKEYNATFLKNYFFELETSYFNKYGSATVVKKRKEQEWLQLLSIMFSSIKKEDVLVWAKEPESINIYLEMESKQLEAYELCLQELELVRETEIEQIQEVIVQMTRLRQIATSVELINPSLHNHSIKEKWVMEFVDNKENYDGLIIFSWHTRYLNILKPKLEAKGFRVGLISGETKNKIIIQDAFQRGEYDIILCNIQAGSKGITLDRADTMIFLDKDWKPDENKQARERFTATSPDRERLRKIYSLQTSNTFQVSGVPVETIDNYMEQVVNEKVKQTEIVNMFRELLLKKKEG